MARYPPPFLVGGSIQLMAIERHDWSPLVPRNAFRYATVVVVVLQQWHSLGGWRYLCMLGVVVFWSFGQRTPCRARYNRQIRRQRRRRAE